MEVIVDNCCPLFHSWILLLKAFAQMWLNPAQAERRCKIPTLQFKIIVVIPEIPFKPARRKGPSTARVVLLGNTNFGDKKEIAACR
jgi:hypothetical protein